MFILIFFSQLEISISQYVFYKMVINILLFSTDATNNSPVEIHLIYSTEAKVSIRTFRSIIHSSVAKQAAQVANVKSSRFPMLFWDPLSDWCLNLLLLLQGYLCRVNEPFTCWSRFKLWFWKMPLVLQP